MQKAKDQTQSLSLANEEEIFNKLISGDHPFRKIKRILDFYELAAPLRATYSDLGKIGYPVEQGIRSLLVQVWKDYSDRQMSASLRENVAVKWFCGFGLTDKTPSYSYFCKLRTRLGRELVARMFNEINEILKEHGLFGEIFTFMDAAALESKVALWEERDKAIKDGQDALNNTNVDRYAKDKDARWGAKGVNKIWYGYKRHCSVDMRHGLINKVKMTAANVLDFQTVKDLLPEHGMVFADKLYDTNATQELISESGCHSGIILKNNRKHKDRNLDNWKSKMRMPFEGTFSKLRKRTKFRGLEKVQMEGYWEAICHNLKKAVRILPAAA